MRTRLLFDRKNIDILFFRQASSLMISQKVRLYQKADWRAVDSSKKRTDEFDLKSKKANKTNLFVRFLGEVSRP